MNNGNGLAADLYFPFWSLLADRFDLVLYDLRSHGWNPVSDIRVHKVPLTEIAQRTRRRRPRFETTDELAASICARLPS